jgi:Icc-related predicted phosphoesterase
MTTMPTLKLLLLSDADGQVARVNQLCEAVVCSADCDVDAVLVAGGLVGRRALHAYEALEAVGCAEGDMTAVVSRLEMIISRVVYIPDDVRAVHALTAAGRVASEGLTG